MKLKKKIDFKWNVLFWNVNNNKLEQYDVVPMFLSELKNLKVNNRPQTKEEFATFLKNESMYHFWSKCEYEIIIFDWPISKEGKKIDIYDQLMMNWDIFVDTFWNKLNK